MFGMARAVMGVIFATWEDDFSPDMMTLKKSSICLASAR